MAITYSECRKSEEYKAWERKQKRLNTFVYTPIRIIIFPIVLLVRLYQWVYHYDDWGLHSLFLFAKISCLIIGGD